MQKKNDHKDENNNPPPLTPFHPGRTHGLAIHSHKADNSKLENRLLPCDTVPGHSYKQSSYKIGGIESKKSGPGARATSLVCDI